MSEENDEQILLESYHPESRKILILDHDDHSVWAFILDGETEEIEFDGFVCSISEPVETEEEVEKFLEEGFSPRITKAFASDSCHQPEILSKDFKADWLDEYTVEVSIDEELFLLMDINNGVCFTKSVKEDGPYGLCFEEKQS